MFSCKYCEIFMNSFFYRTPLVAASEKYEYTVYMLDLLSDCYNSFLLSLIKKHLNEPIIYHNFLFLIEKKLLKLVRFITQSYLPLLNLFLFLSLFSVFLNNCFFRWLAYKSLLSRFLVLINYIMWSYNLFSVIHVFHGPGCSGSESRVWVQVLEVTQL